MKTKAALLIACVLSFVLPVLSWIENTGGFLRLFEIHQPPGQSWYVLSRLFGLLALTAGCWQFFIGLSRRFPVRLISKITTIRTLHSVLGLVSFLLFWSHALCFTTAVSIRKDVIAYNFLLPNLTDHYHSVISIGWLSLILVTIAIFARLLRVRHQDKWHRLVYAVLPIALLHSLLVGSDTRDTMMIFYYFIVTLVWCGAVFAAFFWAKEGAKHAHSA